MKSQTDEYFGIKLALLGGWIAGDENLVHWFYEDLYEDLFKNMFDFKYRKLYLDTYYYEWAADPDRLEKLYSKANYLEGLELSKKIKINLLYYGGTK